MKRYREKDAMKQCVECGEKDLEFSKEIVKKAKDAKYLNIWEKKFDKNTITNECRKALHIIFLVPVCAIQKC